MTLGGPPPPAQARAQGDHVDDSLHVLDKPTQTRNLQNVLQDSIPFKGVQDINRTTAQLRNKLLSHQLPLMPPKSTGIKKEDKERKREEPRKESLFPPKKHHDMATIASPPNNEQEPPPATTRMEDGIPINGNNSRLQQTLLGLSKEDLVAMLLLPQPQVSKSNLGIHAAPTTEMVLKQQQPLYMQQLIPTEMEQFNALLKPSKVKNPYLQRRNWREIAEEVNKFQFEERLEGEENSKHSPINALRPSNIHSLTLCINTRWNREQAIATKLLMEQMKGSLEHANAQFDQVTRMTPKWVKRDFGLIDARGYFLTNSLNVLIMEQPINLEDFLDKHQGLVPYYIDLITIDGTVHFTFPTIRMK